MRNGNEWCVAQYHRSSLSDKGPGSVAGQVNTEKTRQVRILDVDR